MQRQENLIPKSKLELKMGPRQTAQIAEPPQGGKSSMKYVMIHGTEE